MVFAEPMTNSSTFFYDFLFQQCPATNTCTTNNSKTNFYFQRAVMERGRWRIDLILGGQIGGTSEAEELHTLVSNVLNMDGRKVFPWLYVNVVLQHYESPPKQRLMDSEDGIGLLYWNREGTLIGRLPQERW